MKQLRQNIPTTLLLEGNAMIGNSRDDELFRKNSG